MTRSPEPIWESDLPLPVLGTGSIGSGTGTSVPGDIAPVDDVEAGVAYDNGVLLDLDGVAIPQGGAGAPTQPNSPDKLGDSTPLPGR